MCTVLILSDIVVLLCPLSRLDLATCRPSSACAPQQEQTAATMVKKKGKSGRTSLKQKYKIKKRVRDGERAVEAVYFTLDIAISSGL